MLSSLSYFSLALSLASEAVAQTSIRFGPYYSLGATNSYIIESTTTLFPGRTSSPQQDRLALWPGMGTDADALIQSILVSFSNPAA